MDRVFEPDKVTLRDTRTIVLIWIAACLLLLLFVWGMVYAKISYDHAQLHHRAESLARSRAQVYAEQLNRTAKEIDQISLTVSYQWQHVKMPLDLVDQYQKAMHHTPTFPAVIGTDGRIISSWRQASIGLDVSGLPFFQMARDLTDTGLRINPRSPGVGGMTGKSTIRFTRRVNDAKGKFAGVVMVSVEPSYLTSLSADDVLNEGDFVSVRLADSGELLVSKTANGRESVYFRRDPELAGAEGYSHEPGERFIDGKPRYVAWKKLKDYPLVALAGITDDSAVAAYHPAQSSYAAIGGLVTILIVLAGSFGCVTQISNVDRRRNAERIRATFRLAVDGAREAFYMLQPLRGKDGAVIDYRIEDCNERAGELWSRPRDQIIGKSFEQIYSPTVRRKLKRFYDKALENGFMEDEVYVDAGTGHVAGWFHRQAIRSGEGLALIVRDVTEARQHEETLAQLVNTDTLTGLPNRRWLSGYLPGALQRARAARKRAALLFIDLDNFKTINDTLGHAAGDELLCSAAIALKGAVRSMDHVVRLGGDEFTVLIENLDRDSDAERIADQVVRALSASDTEFAKWSAKNVRCSVGIALYPAHAADAHGLLQCADAAMYDAKSAGKGCYRMYLPPAESRDVSLDVSPEDSPEDSPPSPVTLGDNISLSS